MEYWRIVIMSIVILTTGGTFDKVYFDANSEYSIGEPCISSILDEGNVTSDFRIKSILKKDSLCLLYTSPSPRDATLSRMTSSA